MSTTPDFPSFFKALWGYDPFPWQTMLAERVAQPQGRWPRAIDLPTAAGKTACIDAAIYALACQAETPVAERTAPRRIWFVVDRRIVVDEAFDRAMAVTDKLHKADSGPLKEVAERLRIVGGTRRELPPLAVARLRGGILRDYGWSRLPSQPAVITSTVDQLGSRLMFRGYGHSHLAAPIFAGLAANDSLVVLDEAHCSIPFLQTLHSIATYRGDAWAESPLKTPFDFTFLSATPPQDIREDARFPGAEREVALKHDELLKRLNASKVAELIPPKPERRKDTDPLIAEAAENALSFVKGGKRRVAVIVNRVRTAEKVFNELERRKEKDKVDVKVVLLTGRIRPFERDRLVNKWKPFLKASKPEDPGRPILFVSTQCIEVGADFSFDALVTECASLDALRQRFGRLDRMGEARTSPAAILIREQDAKDGGDDPVYGAALSKTWALLSDKASEHEGRKIDFGFKALDAALEDVEDPSSYLAPKPDAPVLLPAHLDLLCQTAPTPHPDPDIQIYLHGKDRSSPEVRVLWRSDLSEDRTENWIETISLCPPISGEMLSVPLHRFRNWLAKRKDANDDADVEGIRDSTDESPEGVRPFLLWRGRDRTKVSNDANKIRPNDVIVLPANSNYAIAGLGQAPREAFEWGFGADYLDLWERAYDDAGRPPALRIHREVLKPWLSCPQLSELITLAEDPACERKTLQQAIDAVTAERPADDASAQPPRWLIRRLRKIRKRRFVAHPDGGVIALSRSTRPRKVSEPDLFADDDDLTSALTPADGKEVSLEKHSMSVKYVVKRLATLCLPDGFTDWLQRAAYYHDVGKLDERFQVMLRHGNMIGVADAEEPLAKSADVPVSSSRRRAIRKASGLPEKFRHEMLSLQLAQRHAPLPEDESAAALILHLIASHHGHARPFAPICLDPEPPSVKGHLGEIALEISADERSASIPAHHLGSGLSERFWQLTRRYGWWGLAYLEAILRLGDWYGSEFIKTGEDAEL